MKPDLDGIVVFSDSDDENDICSLNKQVASIVKSKWILLCYSVGSWQLIDSFRLNSSRQLSLKLQCLSKVWAYLLVLWNVVVSAVSVVLWQCNRDVGPRRDL